MGCFLGCIGLSAKRKCRKPGNKVLPGEDHATRRCLSYKPLDSIYPDVTDHPADSDIRNKPKQQLNIKAKKKVRFNLNVQAYEPVPKAAQHSWESVEEKERSGKSTCESSLHESEDSAALITGLYPTNYRYQSYDEDEEIAYESDYDDDYNDDDDFEFEYEEELPKQFNILPKELKKMDFLNTLAEDETKKELTGLNLPARDRSRYVDSVLNPIENLTQWKAVKVKAAQEARRITRKENIASLQRGALNHHHQYSRPLLQEVAVDSSLSNWLASSSFKTETIKCSSTIVYATKVK